MEDALVSRRELEAMLFAIADMNVNLRVVRDLLKEALGGEEEGPEDDG